MAVDLSWVAQPDEDISGNLTNTFANVAGIPWNDATNQSHVMSGGTVAGQHVWGLPGMSSAPGDNKGWVLWLRGRAGNSAVDRWFDVTVAIEDNAGVITTIPTFVWGQGNSTILTYQFDLTDLDFSTANLADLRIRASWVRTGGNNSISFYWMALTKSPLVAANESPSIYATLPVDAEYRAADLVDLGGVNTDMVTVWPDATGKGQHLFLVAGAPANLRVDSPETWVEDNGFGGITGMASRALTPHLGLGRLIRWFGYDIANAPGGSAGIQRGTDGWARTLAQGNTSSATTRGDKHLFALRTFRVGILMHSDGSGASHSEGTDIHLDNTWYLHTGFVPTSDAGSPLGWDDTAALGSPQNTNTLSGLVNVLETYGFFNKASDSRPFNGGISNIVLMGLDGGGAADVIDARDDWLAGEADDPSGGSVAVVDVSAAGAGVKATAGAAQASVTVTTAGSGRKTATGGAQAANSVSGAGAGRKHATGGSIASVEMSATGGGENPGADPTGGSIANVEVGVGGTGSKSVTGGASATVEVTVTGAGAKHASGGAEASIEVTVTGGGRSGEPPVFDRQTVPGRYSPADVTGGTDRVTVAGGVATTPI